MFRNLDRFMLLSLGLRKRRHAMERENVNEFDQPHGDDSGCVARQSGHGPERVELSMLGAARPVSYAPREAISAGV